MGHPLRPELAGALVEQSVRLLPRMSQQELCNTMWALAVMDLMDESLFATFCDTLAGHLGHISPEGIHQVGACVGPCSPVGQPRMCSW